LYGSSLAEAMNASTAYDTIAVLSILFEIQKEDNPDLSPITECQYRTKFYKIHYCKLLS
jgi:hypothetical protein